VRSDTTHVVSSRPYVRPLASPQTTNLELPAEERLIGWRRRSNGHFRGPHSGERLSPGLDSPPLLVVPSVITTSYCIYKIGQYFSCISNGIVYILDSQ
jgi:hypothetical protein